MNLTTIQTADNSFEVRAFCPIDYIGGAQPSLGLLTGVTLKPPPGQLSRAAVLFVSTGSATLAWAPSVNADRYRVEVANSSGVYTPVATISDPYVYTVTGLDVNILYSFRVVPGSNHGAGGSFYTDRGIIATCTNLYNTTTRR